MRCFRYMYWNVFAKKQRTAQCVSHAVNRMFDSRRGGTILVFFHCINWADGWSFSLGLSLPTVFPNSFWYLIYLWHKLIQWVICTLLSSLALVALINYPYKPYNCTKLNSFRFPLFLSFLLWRYMAENL